MVPLGQHGLLRIQVNACVLETLAWQGGAHDSFPVVVSGKAGAAHPVGQYTGAGQGLGRGAAAGAPGLLIAEGDN